MRTATQQRPLIARALRAFRALTPGESRGFLLARPLPESFLGSFRVVVERNSFAADTFDVQLEEFDGGWKVYGRDDGQLQPFEQPDVKPDELRAVVEFFDREARGMARAIEEDRAENDARVRAEFGPVLLAGRDYDDDGYPSVAFRLIVEEAKDRGGLCHVAIEQATHDDPENWLPTYFGSRQGDGCEGHEVFVPPGDVPFVVRFYAHLMDVHERALGENVKAYKGIVPKPEEFDGQWAATAARRRAERGRANGKDGEEAWR